MFYTIILLVLAVMLMVTGFITAIHGLHGRKRLAEAVGMGLCLTGFSILINLSNLSDHGIDLVYLYLIEFVVVSVLTYKMQKPLPIRC